MKFMRASGTLKYLLHLFSSREFFHLEREFVSITENPLNKGDVVFATVSFKGSIS